MWYVLSPHPRRSIRRFLVGRGPKSSIFSFTFLSRYSTYWIPRIFTEVAVLDFICLMCILLKHSSHINHLFYILSNPFIFIYIYTQISHIYLLLTQLLLISFSRYRTYNGGLTNSDIYTLNSHSQNLL